MPLPFVDFELITEFHRPIAAVIPNRLRAEQLKFIYSLLSPNAVNQIPLAERWSKYMVVSEDDWARAQLRRVPCVPPSAIKLTFGL